jgi:thiamine-phosphate pyrophosphorylase
MANRLALPPLYVILDAALLPSDPIVLTSQLLHAGVRLFQYRNKTAPAREVLQTARSLCATASQGGATFIVNDRPDIARLASGAGVHLGQDDLDVAAARMILGRNAIIGLSTHNLQQFCAAIKTDADYIAVGPVFATSTKANPEPVVGVDLIKKARRLTSKPIVAIGGIRLERVREAIDAGADSVAVISDILAAKNPADRAQQFLQILPSATRSAGN